MKKIVTALVSLLLSGCLSKPPGIMPVEDFQIDRYLGRWHEIARLDHSFERGLQQVSAEYSLLEDGGVGVINKGYSTTKKKWSTAEGKAYFVESPGTAFLKVSFFGPFYNSYIVFELDHDYQYAYITGADTSYLWFLSRTPEVPKEHIEKFITKVSALGYDTKKLIIVEQNSRP